MLKHLSELKSVIITVKGDKVSEAYRDYVLPYWRKEGVFPETFDAITPETIIKDIRFDDIIMVKYEARGFRKPHTPTEQAVWMSHIDCMRMAIEEEQPILVLEHDAIPVNPEGLKWDTSAGYQSFDKGAMGCYVVTPEFAFNFIHWLYFKHRTIDTGPGSMLSWVNSERFVEDKMILPGSSEYSPCVTQVIDRRFGTVIDHYSGTPAEKYQWREFQHYEEVVLDL